MKRGFICIYHFVVVNVIIDCITKEIQNCLSNRDQIAFRTIYFGGGTPSLLDEFELNSLLDKISQYVNWSDVQEFTFEANPDDIYGNKLKLWRQLGVNRLSIGVQSFVQEELVWMNRIHDSNQARTAILQAQDQGIDNLSIDLIYGLIHAQPSSLAYNLSIMNDLSVPHFSAYALTIEENTKLAYDIKKGQSLPPDENFQINQFDEILDFCFENHFEDYEISNYAKKGFRSLHNSNYWNGSMYFGFGPSAHSFVDGIRYESLKNNALYMNAVESGLDTRQAEEMTDDTRWNEHIMLRLRTKDGLNTEPLNGSPHYGSLLNNLNQLVDDGYLLREGEVFRFTRKGKYIADHLVSELFV